MSEVAHMIHHGEPEPCGSPTSLESDPLVFVNSYNNFEALAHKPRGSPARHSVRVYRLHRKTGSLTLLTVNNTLENPAFMRYGSSFNCL